MNYRNHEIINYILKILSQCDGAQTADNIGFNQYDSKFVRSVLSRATVSYAQLRALYNVLKKYKKQLTAIGLNYDDLKLPDSSQATKTSNTTTIPQKETICIYKQNENAYFKCGFMQRDDFNSVLYFFKSNHGFKFDGELKQWYISLKDKNFISYMLFIVKNKVEIFCKLGFTVDQQILDIIGDAKEPKVETQIVNPDDNLYELSSKMDSDIVVEGLKKELFAYQKVSVEYSKNRKGVLIADEMGTGKTIQAIAILQYHNAFPAILVCPAIGKKNWFNEIHAWLYDKKVQIVKGEKDTLLPDMDIYIINYDIIHKYADKFVEIRRAKSKVPENLQKGKKPRKMRVLSRTLLRDVKAIILDESHYIKNKRSRRAETILDYFKEIEYKILLSGTPILNKPIELVSSLDFLDVFKSWTGNAWKWTLRYCNPKNNGFGYVYTSSNEEELNQELKKRVMLRRLKKDVLKDLPEKMPPQIIYIPIDNRKLYNEVELDTTIWYRKKLDEIADLTPEEKRERLNSVSYKAEQLRRIEYLKQVTLEGKYKNIKLWIDNVLEQTNKLVLFAHHEDFVMRLLKDYGDSAVHLIGGMTDVADDQVQKFQKDDSVKLFIGGMRAAGTLITLTAANNLAFLELDWTPSIHAQCSDRIHRIGQEKIVNIYYLLGEDTIETEIYKTVIEKGNTISTILDGTPKKDIKISNSGINDIYNSLKQN